MTNKSTTENNKDIEDATIVEDKTASSTSEAATSQPIKEKSKKKKGNVLVGLAFVVALLAVAAAAYLAWVSLQQAEQLQSLTVDAKNNYQQTQKFQQSLQTVQSETMAALAMRDQERAQLSSALEDANLIIAAHSRRLRSLSSTTTDDWRLAEVEYLLRLANQRILISQDTVTALSLLNTADQILLTLADPRFFDIRKAIAEDRAALVLVGQQDLDGVFLRLSALTKQLDKLPLVVAPAFDAGDESVIAEEDAVAASSWQQKLNDIGASTWQELKSLVVVSERNENIKPLLPPEQQYYVRGNLQLMINQSQLALLDGRQSIYSDSLDRAEQWLVDYFPSGEHAIQSVITDLQQLQKVKIDIELPDVASSLIAVKEFLAKQNQVDSAPLVGEASSSSNESLIQSGEAKQ
jgi:uroporphyrin-3 C-methyltransferase